MSTTSQTPHFATRTVHGIDDSGTSEVITLWIEWQHGGQWAVGRVVNVHLRENPKSTRPDDFLFVGYEMQDALEAANEALDADLDVSRGDGRNEAIEPFEEEELRFRLERWFFDHQR